MTHPKIECYPCGEDATLLEPAASRDKIVVCRRCTNRYRLADDALRYIFEKEDKKEILNDYDKEKFSEYIYKHIVRITPDVIKKVTGKESVGYL